MDRTLPEGTLCEGSSDLTAMRAATAQAFLRDKPERQYKGENNAIGNIKSPPTEPGFPPLMTLTDLRRECTTQLAFLVKQVENGYTVTAEISYIDPVSRVVKGVETRNYVAIDYAAITDVMYAVERSTTVYPGNCQPTENQLDLGIYPEEVAKKHV